MEYNKEYFENGPSLQDYSWKGQYFHTTANLLAITTWCPNYKKVLDFGCGKGFLVTALRGCGYEAHGCDISKYCIDNCDPDAKDYVKLAELADLEKLRNKDHYELVVSFFVLEHLHLQEIHRFFNIIFSMPSLKSFIFRVPVLTPNTDPIEYKEKLEIDPTHKTVRPFDWWINQIDKKSNNKFKVVDGRYTFTQAGFARGLFLAQRLDIVNKLEEEERFDVEIFNTKGLH